MIGVLALALVAAAVVGLPAAPDDGAQPAGETIDTLTPFDATGNVDGPAVGASPPGVSDAPASAPVLTPEPPPADAYPPGVNASGLVDAEALLAAHVRALEERDYRLVMTYREFRAEYGQAGWRRLIATVDRPASVRTSVDSHGNVIGFDDPVPITELYADGEAVYYRNATWEDVQYRTEQPERSPARTGVFARPYLADALAANDSQLIETTVHNGTRLFRLRLVGDTDPEPRIEREIEPISVEVELRYDRGEFVVEPPPWLEEARRATERPAAHPDGSGRRPATCSRPRGRPPRPTPTRGSSASPGSAHINLPIDAAVTPTDNRVVDL